MRCAKLNGSYNLQILYIKMFYQISHYSLKMLGLGYNTVLLNTV